MASTTFVDPFKTADVFGNNLDDFDIWDEDEDFNPENNKKGSMKKFDNNIFSEKKEKNEASTGSISEEVSSEDGGNAQKPQRQKLGRRVPAKRPSLRRKLSRAELLVDEHDTETSTNGRSLASKGSKGSHDDKSTSHETVSSHSHSGREKSERRSSRHLRSSKSPSRRRPTAGKKEASMRNLVSLLNKSNPDVETGTASDDDIHLVVSKSSRARPKSMREMKTEPSKNDVVENNMEDALSKSSDNPDHRPEPVRGKLQQSNSLQARKARLAQAEVDPKDGGVVKPTRRGDPTRTRPSRTSSMNQRLDARVPARRPSVSGGRGLPRRSASFAIRRDRSGNASIDGASKSLLASIESSAEESKRGESRPSLPGRGLPRRGGSFASRRERPGTAALDNVMKSKLATITASKGEITEDEAGAPPRDPSRGNLSRNPSSGVSRRLPPSRNASHSGRGLQRTARSVGGQTLQRTSSLRF